MEQLGAALVAFMAALFAGLALRSIGDFSETGTSASERVPFLGGHEPGLHAWNRYHARYYPMALLFLAFDMEMVFMYPWARVFLQEGMIALGEMGVFIGILLLGVLYGWRERAFTWA